MYHTIHLPVSVQFVKYLHFFMNIHICVANKNIEGYLVIAIAAEVCLDSLTVLQPWSRNVERVRSKIFNQKPGHLNQGNARITWNMGNSLKKHGKRIQLWSLFYACTFNFQHHSRLINYSTKCFCYFVMLVFLQLLYKLELRQWVQKTLIRKKYGSYR